MGPYQEITCSCCGVTCRLCYVQEVEIKLRGSRMCHSCHYWDRWAKECEAAQKSIQEGGLPHYWVVQDETTRVYHQWDR